MAIRCDEKKSEIPKNVINLTSLKYIQMTCLSGMPRKGLSSTCFGIQRHGTPGTLRVQICEKVTQVKASK